MLKIPEYTKDYLGIVVNERNNKHQLLILKIVLVVPHHLAVENELNLHQEIQAVVAAISEPQWGKQKVSYQGFKIITSLLRVFQLNKIFFIHVQYSCDPLV